MANENEAALIAEAAERMDMDVCSYIGSIFMAHLTDGEDLTVKQLAERIASREYEQQQRESAQCS